MTTLDTKNILGVNLIKESILQEAQRLTTRDRQREYGHPRDDFERTAAMWRAILGKRDITARHVALCLIAVKISRDVHAGKRDNLVDIAGYANCADLLAVAAEDTPPMNEVDPAGRLDP